MVAARRCEPGYSQAIILMMAAVCWDCGYVGNALALSTYPQAAVRRRCDRSAAAHPRGHNGATATCRIGRHGADLNRQVRIDAVPHTVPSTHAGALFQALRTSSMCGRTCAGGSASPAVRVRALPRSSADLQLLRPRPDLLRRRLCTGGAISRPARGRPALPDEPSRSAGPRSTGASLACPAKERDASGFPATAGG